MFYQVLEAMLEKDMERSGKDAVLPLTTCAKFHKCLAACAFEVVIAAYHMVRSPGLLPLPNKMLRASFCVLGEHRRMCSAIG